MHRIAAPRVMLLIVFAVLCAIVALFFARPAHGVPGRDTIAVDTRSGDERGPIGSGSGQIPAPPW